MERRDFIRNGGRLFFLGGIAAGIGYLMANGKIEKYGQCKIASTCKGCAKVTLCNDWQADKFRQHQLLTK